MFPKDIREGEPLRDQTTRFAAHAAHKRHDGQKAVEPFAHRLCPNDLYTGNCQETEWLPNAATWLERSWQDQWLGKTGCLSQLNEDGSYRINGSGLIALRWISGIYLTGMVKKVVQQVRSRFGARSVLSVREYDKIATCLREAAFSLRSHFGEGGPAKAGNAAGGFFQHSPIRGFGQYHRRDTLNRLNLPGPSGREHGYGWC